MKAMEIAKEAKKEYPASQHAPFRAHQNGIREFTREKGFYVITEKGKKALGIPETTKEKAAAILSLCTTR